MNRLSAPTCRKLTQTISRRLPERYRRDDSGLTTLEWLLIVAAVAGLAALAVVLVTNVVRDTSEQISGQNARTTAARVAANAINTDAAAATPADRDAVVAASRRFGNRCRNLAIIYSDVEGLTATWDEPAAGTNSAASWAAEFAATPPTIACTVA